MSKLSVFCSECHRPIDTKRDNVGRDNRLIICADCTMLRCAGVPKEKIQERLPKKFSKQRRRNNRK